MEKSCQTSADNDTTTKNSNSGTITSTDSNPNPNNTTASVAVAVAAAATSSSSSALHHSNTVRMLNKNSHKIAKHHHHQNHGSAVVNQQENPNPSAAAPSSPPNVSSNPAAHVGPPQPQPPVYNINKNDFRDVVQKLTGSPAHHQLNPRIPAAPAVPSSPPPPPTVTKVPPSTQTTASSRLHKIRPPPLAHLNSRPNPTIAAAGGGNMWTRVPMVMPSSPLPPLPTFSGAAESPITAYMRRLNGGGGAQQQGLMMVPGSMGAPLFPLPTSPLAFGCMPSPGSAYQLTLPPSPRLPMPSPDAPKD